MKKLSFFVTLITALAIAASLSLAADGEAHHRFKFKVGADSDAIVIDDLAVGETRQLFTDSGKEVVVTREEDGLKLTVDGKEINVDTLHGHHGAAVVNVGGEDGEPVNVFVKKIVAHVAHGDGDEGGHVMVWAGDAGEGASEDVMVWTGDDGESHVLSGEEGHAFTFIAAPDVAESVIASGVLDDLDPAKREEILKAIRDAGPRTIHQTVTLHEEEDHEDR